MNNLVAKNMSKWINKLSLFLTSVKRYFSAFLSMCSEKCNIWDASLTAKLTSVMVKKPRKTSKQTSKLNDCLSYQEAKRLYNEISALIRESPESSLTPFHHVRIQEVGSLQLRAWPWWHSHLGLPSLQTERNTFLLVISHAVSGILL